MGIERRSRSGSPLVRARRGGVDPRALALALVLALAAGSAVALLRSGGAGTAALVRPQAAAEGGSAGFGERRAELTAAELHTRPAAGPAPTQAAAPPQEVALPMPDVALPAPSHPGAGPRDARQGHERLAVQVLLEDGRPAFGAHVRLVRIGEVHAEPTSSSEERADRHGRCAFRLGPEGNEPRIDLIAYLGGRVPAVLEDVRASRRAHPGEELVLRLGGEMLSITGRVLRADGRPAVGWVVDVEGRSVVGGTTLEGLAWGGGTAWTRAGEDGSFLLEGLLDRYYDVFAIAPGSGGFASTPNVAAGGEVLLLERTGATRAVRVRVLAWSGAPLRSERVSASFGSARSREYLVDLADERGEALLHLPYVPAEVHVDAVHCTEPASVRLPAGEIDEVVEITVERWARVRIETSVRGALFLEAQGPRAGSYRIDGTIGYGGTLRWPTRGKLDDLWMRESTNRIRFRAGAPPEAAAPWHVIGPLDPDAPENVIRL